jgi:hypothetical protein
MRNQLITEVERKAALLAQTRRAAERPRRRRGSLLSGWKLAPAATALLAVGVLAGVAIAGFGGGMTSYEGTTQLQGARVAIEKDDGTTTLVAHGLPEPEGRDVYKAWLKCPGVEAPEPSVVFLPSDGSVATEVPDVCADLEAVLVTRENNPQATAPTEDPVAEIPMASAA